MYASFFNQKMSQFLSIGETSWHNEGIQLKFSRIDVWSVGTRTLLGMSSNAFHLSQKHAYKLFRSI